MKLGVLGRSQRAYHLCAYRRVKSIDLLTHVTGIKIPIDDYGSVDRNGTRYEARRVPALQGTQISWGPARRSAATPPLMQRARRTELRTQGQVVTRALHPLQRLFRTRSELV